MSVLEVGAPSESCSVDQLPNACERQKVNCYFLRHLEGHWEVGKGSTNVWINKRNGLCEEMFH